MTPSIIFRRPFGSTRPKHARSLREAQNCFFPAPPLEPVRTADLVSYHAETVVTATIPQTIRARVVGTLEHGGGALLKYSRDCPLILYAYRDRSRRDSAPRSGQAEWTSVGPCGPELQQVVLQRHQTKSFEVETTAREILGARLPPGRYHFAVAVRSQWRTLFLSAGQAELTR